MKSKRFQDSQNSKVVERFLDLYLYKEGAERVHDRERQLQGIDVIYGNFIIDEKCALDYINKPLSTFAFELSSVNRNGERYGGWLINENLKTTHYLLCYIDKCRVDYNPSVDDIKEMEVILVSKESVIKFIEERCDTLPEIVKKAKNIQGSFSHKGFRIVKSKHKVESPINILINRYDLRQIAVTHLNLII